MATPLYNNKERNRVTFVLLIILGGFILYSVRGIFGAILGTIVMYTIFRPMFLYIMDKWKLQKNFAAIFIILFSFLVIILPILGVGSMVVSKIVEIQENPQWIQQVIQQISDFAGDKLHQPDLIENVLRNILSSAGNIFTSLLSGAANLLLSISVMYFLLYFVLVDYKQFEAGLFRFAPFRQENALRFGRELRNITYSNVLGQGLISLIQGSLVALGYWYFNFNDPIFWGVISAILSFIPVVGAPMIFVPASIWAIVQGDNFNGIGMLLFGLIFISNIDNVLRLIIAKRVGNIHPIITIIGVIIGIPLFGLMGLVYGPLLLSYFLITVRIYETNKMAEKRLEQLRRENIPSNQKGEDIDPHL